MNNKTVMIIISAIIVILLAVILIWGVSSCSAGNDEPISVGSEENSSDATLESGGKSDIVFNDVYDEEWEIDEPISSDKSSSSNDEFSTGSQTSSSASSSENESSSSSTSSKNPVNIIKPSDNDNNSSNSSSEENGNEDNEDDGKMTYEKYLSLSPEEQQKFYNTFASLQEYSDWYNNAKAEYDAKQNYIEVEGEINIGDYINP